MNFKIYKHWGEEIGILPEILVSIESLQEKFDETCTSGSVESISTFANRIYGEIFSVIRERIGHMDGKTVQMVISSVNLLHFMKGIEYSIEKEGRTFSEELLEKEFFELEEFMRSGMKELHNPVFNHPFIVTKEEDTFMKVRPFLRKILQDILSDLESKTA